MTRLIDADKLYPDCLTKEGTLAISQSQIANAETIDINTKLSVAYLKGRNQGSISYLHQDSITKSDTQIGKEK